MPKLISYACDKCGKSADYEDLYGISAYSFGPTSLDDPKLLELDLVCEECREEFISMIKGWIG